MIAHTLEQAARVFGTNRGSIRWPAGLTIPTPASSGLSGRPLEEAVSRSTRAQHRILTWADHFGLHASSTGCCPRWLQRNLPHRCTPEDNTCTHYGANPPDQEWLTHPIAWIRDRRPVALTSAPPTISPGAKDRLAWWPQQDAALRVAFGTGWHGFTTTQVLVWRADRIPDLTPANDPL
ncbi:hypothetical protein [Mangrovactinospora gilvigrisea]|uniref:hypothetical protein n=1 Tax=Mangrovactinospora gilvigrisea TaxID=1428644 RepID=UPI000AAE570F|nr:hypothetical protein [Mangrovactinospora gilvigrisea]